MIADDQVVEEVFGERSGLNVLKCDGQLVPDATNLFEDSIYVPGFLSKFMGDAFASAAFAWLTQMSRELWVCPKAGNNKFRLKSQPRPKMFLTRSDQPYQQRYHRFEAAPPVKAMIDFIAEHLTLNNAPIIINCCVGSLYRATDGNIDYHAGGCSDDTIVSISLGEERVLFSRPLNPEKPRLMIVLQPGDLLVLGPKANAAYRHEIILTDQEVGLKRDGKGPIGPHISLVMLSK